MPEQKMISEIPTSFIRSNSTKKSVESLQQISFNIFFEKAFRRGKPLSYPLHSVRENVGSNNFAFYEKFTIF